MLADQGSSFRNAFVIIGACSDVKVQRTGMEARSSIGHCEKYHHPLRNTYCKILKEHQHTKLFLALATLVKEMNDTLGVEGLVPSVLIFGEFLKMQSQSRVPEARPTVKRRALTAVTAQQRVEKQMARVRLKRDLQHKTPKLACHVSQPGDKVLVWRKSIVNHLTGQWLGSFTVTHFDEGKTKFIVQDTRIGASRLFHVE